MTIVCATHFSDSSFVAVKTAAELARKHRQPLWLVTVVPLGEDGNPARDALLLEAAALSSAEVDVRTAVLHGTLERAVGQFCTEKKALLLVVGDTSRKISPVFAGTLDKLSGGIEIPLLVVRDPKPFEAWAQGTAPIKVLLALDHTWSSALARDWIYRLAEYGSLDLVAAHIWWPKEEYERRGLPAPGPEETHAVLALKMLEETQAALGGLPANVKHRVELQMGIGHIGEQLLAIAESEQADIFVLGTHPLRGPLGQVGSISHEVLVNAPMSVAVIPGLAVLPPTVPSERPTAPSPR